MLTLLLLVAALFNGCSEIENNPVKPKEPDFAVESTNIKTFEIVTLTASKKVEANSKGTLGEVPIDLIQTSDSTLSFIVPDVMPGAHSLKFASTIIDFTVTKTIEVSSEQLFRNLFQRFDTGVAALNPATDAEKEEVQQMNQFKENFTKALNGLSEEQKKQTVLFFEANKEAFTSFTHYVTTNLNAATTLRLAKVNRQTDCPETDYRSFYDCTSANLANSYTQFKGSTKKMLEMLTMASAMGGVALKLSALGPVALGITAVGMSLPLTMALYLGVTEVWPTWVKLRDDTNAFLKAPWIFRQELFEKLNLSFQTDKDEDLNLDAGFRTVGGNDTEATTANNVPRSTAVFIKAFATVNTYWDKLSALFGELPTFQPGEKLITLLTDNIQISAISNSQVQLVSKAGESVKFKSLSGKDESFDFKIKVTKEGFTQEKVVSAKITGKVVYAETIESFIGDLQPYAGPGNRSFTPLRVKVKDATGKALEGVKVEWRVRSGGGQIIAGAIENATPVSFSQPGIVYEEDGTANAVWQLGPSGEQIVEAITRKKDGSLVSGSPVVFRVGQPLLGKWNLIYYKTKTASSDWKPRDLGTGNYLTITSDKNTSGQFLYSDWFNGNTTKGTYEIYGNRQSPTTYSLNFTNTDLERGGNKPVSLNGLFTIKSLTSTELLLENRVQVPVGNSFYTEYREVLFQR